ncbi:MULTISPECIES: GNAT family N-acetyltransferase [unclassified Fusibacter]|uniref:GNAT family N-acetyltransferase n=1 Tax=unclassified Fusibacter TaxID=2624464 RepID=UPI001013401C|nr:MULTISPECIES: GNAT family N-acetyltransferase [unclassified Fusibacter]MCK8060524.1 GNAT family N-acetyltransferase [Fusibacter sp. A2]NPE20187.1 GNAT family N-acetyltransferase [Fusibacter sp. A1]RXV63397.1 GNAT family N-acetyltransferase [Fusibacter sp. A1]
MDRFTIRLAKREDARAIIEVNLKTWESAYKNIVDDAFIQKRWTDFEDTVANYETRLSEDDSIVFVAEIDGRIIGFATAGEDRLGKYDGELYAIYLLPEFQGNGIGHALYNRIEMLFKAQGKKNMIIWSLKANPHRGFYVRMGGVKKEEKDITIGEQVLREIGYVFEL